MIITSHAGIAIWAQRFVPSFPGWGISLSNTGEFRRASSLDLDEQSRSGFTYGYSVYQQMERVFDRILDRTRSRLDVPTLRTLFGAKHRPGRHGSSDLSLQLAAMIETPRYDLTMFKVHFGLLTLKAYTKGEHVLRFEEITHNTKQLRCGRIMEKFPEITTRLAGMVDRFTTTLDCVDLGFLPEHILDELPLPTRIGTTRFGGIDLNKPRIHATLAAVLALAPAPDGFTVTDLTTKVHTMTGQTHYTTRQAAYDLHAPRGALLYPQRSWEELEGRFLGPMAHLDAKARGNSSLPEKQWLWSGV